MLQHQMLTSQMFTFMSGCLGQLFQQSGLQLPQPPTTAELQADPTAPLPPAGGFVNVPLSTFPQTPLLQTGTFTVPQTTPPQAAVTSSFLAQLQMTTPPSSQLVSLLTTGALVFETPARTTLPSPPASTPLPTFTTRGQRVWDRRTTTFERSRSRSQQHLPPTPFLLLPRLLQLPARRLSHLLRLLRVPRHQLGTFSARTPTTTTLPASLCDLRGSSLLRRQILPLRLKLSLLFGACCQRGR
jgi:hypothetical protein